MKIKINNNSYPVERRLRLRRGTVLLLIYNEHRQQYEVYSLTQTPKLVPLGADESSGDVAFAEAIDTIKQTRRQ